MALKSSSPDRQEIQPLIVSAFPVQRKQIVLYSIGNPYVGYLSGHVIAQRLFCNRLIQRNFRRFAFYQQSKSTVIGGCCNIRAFGKPVHQQRLFDADQSGSDSMVCTQPVDNMLSYPFFRGKTDIFFSDCVENIVFLPVSLESVIERRKVKRREQPQV